MILDRKSWFFINPLKIDFFNFRAIKNGRKSFFRQKFDFFQKYATSAPIWYFHFVRTPSSSRDLMLQTLIASIWAIQWTAIFWNPHIMLTKNTARQEKKILNRQLMTQPFLAPTCSSPRSSSPRGTLRWRGEITFFFFFFTGEKSPTNEGSQE